MWVSVNSIGLLCAFGTTGLFSAYQLLFEACLQRGTGIPWQAWEERGGVSNFPGPGSFGTFTWLNGRHLACGISGLGILWSGFFDGGAAESSM